MQRRAEWRATCVGGRNFAAGPPRDIEDLGLALGRQVDGNRQARGRVEGVERAFVVRATAVFRLEPTRTPQSAGPDEPGTQILIADEPHAGAELGRMEAGLVRHAVRGRIAQQPVAGQHRIERAHEPRLDMHGVEIGIAEIGAEFVHREFPEARHLDAARPVAEILQPQAEEFRAARGRRA